MNAALDASEVAGYLKSHPEFFDHYADLLAQVHIPDPHGGRAISITERQLGALRDRNKQLEAKLAELIRFGEENDAISEKVHQMTVALIAAADFSAVMRVLYSHLGGAFAVPHVALRLWGIAEAEDKAEQAEFSPADDTTKALASSLKHPYCGPSSGLEALSWLSSGVRSLALVPLRRENETIGLLALGSEEPHRFYPEMGTLFLSRFGGIAAAALLRTLT
ncbi:MAG: DUF484 family protein [Proteobacteria bacterium]|nr:DUF484 family protein [Pseudomonadota bacterium]